MILGVFHSKKNHQILTFFRFMRWIARFDTMNFRKEDLNLGRLQKLRKEVFPDAPGDYEKALFKHGMAHGRLPDGHLSHLTKRFCHRKKKGMFFSTYFKKHPQSIFFQRKSSSFFGDFDGFFQWEFTSSKKNARPWRWIHLCLGRIFRFHVVIPSHCICSQLDEHLWNLREEQFVWMHAQDWSLWSKIWKHPRKRRNWKK